MKKNRVVVANGKTYEEYEPVVMDNCQEVDENGRLVKYKSIKRITVTDYENIVIIDGKLFTEVKKK